MKPVLLALTLPLFLTGCAAYVGDYGPGYPGYYDGYGYGGPGFVAFSSYDRGYYHHGYNHYDNSRRGAVTFRGSSHVSSHAVANVSRSGGHSGGGHSASVSVRR